MNSPRTKEEQYQSCLDAKKERGLQTLGLMSNYSWLQDPKHLVFVLSRYKFVSKIFSGFDKVLEVGCGDAFGTRIVCAEVGSLTAVDFDPVFLDDIENRRNGLPASLETRLHDILDGPVAEEFDGVFSVDVLEHIPKEKEDIFISNMALSLCSHGVLVLGTPSASSQVHASPESRKGHVNCKNAKELRDLLVRYFSNVFVFSMNDEVVHTGFYPMAQYLFALCCAAKR